jgi:hypothetical protein
MTSTVTSLAPAHPVVLVVHEGDVTGADMRHVARQIGELAGDERNVHVLSDFTAATDLPGAIEVMDLMERLEEAGVGPEFRQAFVWPTSLATRLELDVLKQAEQNRGLHAKAFGTREDALAWLES